MTDHPKDDAETPMQRALRLKKEAAAAHSHPAAAKSEFRRGAAAMAAGHSRPAMRK